MSEHTRSVLLGTREDRRCTARNASGERCGRASTIGAFVCDQHGSKSPRSRAAIRDRLIAICEPAVGALLRALETAPPCEACGRSDSDRDPVTIRAAQIVLDRCGFGPQLTLQQAMPEETPADLSPDELVERAELMLEHAKRIRDFSRLQLSDGAVDGVVVPEDSAGGFEVADAVQADAQKTLDISQRCSQVLNDSVVGPEPIQDEKVQATGEVDHLEARTTEEEGSK